MIRNRESCHILSNSANQALNIFFLISGCQCAVRCYEQFFFQAINGKYIWNVVLVVTSLLIYHAKLAPNLNLHSGFTGLQSKLGLFEGGACPSTSASIYIYAFNHKVHKASHWWLNLWRILQFSYVAELHSCVEGSNIVDGFRKQIIVGKGVLNTLLPSVLDWSDVLILSLDCHRNFSMCQLSSLKTRFADLLQANGTTVAQKFDSCLVTTKWFQFIC